VKRIHRIAAVGALALAAWLWALSRAAPNHWPLVAAAPVVAAAAFALLLLWRLVQGVLTFRTCPEAEAELRKDIERARRMLAARGFRFEEEEDSGNGTAAASGARRRGGNGNGASANGSAAAAGAVEEEAVVGSPTATRARRRRA
jgi:hypothetical protein